MKYDCLVHLYNLYYEKDGKIVKGGLYTNCFIEHDVGSKKDLPKVEEIEEIEETKEIGEIEKDNKSEQNTIEDLNTKQETDHDYNTICQKAGNYVGDSLQNFIKNPESDPVKFEIEKVALYDEHNSKLMGLALYSN